jgi:hypothetical protein
MILQQTASMTHTVSNMLVTFQRTRSCSRTPRFLVAPASAFFFNKQARNCSPHPLTHPLMFAVLMVAVGALLKVPNLQKQAKHLNKNRIHYETMLGVLWRSHGAQRRAFPFVLKDFFYKKNLRHGMKRPKPHMLPSSQAKAKY